MHGEWGGFARARAKRASGNAVPGDSPAIAPPPYCTEFECGDFLAPGPRRQYVVVLSTEKRPSSRPLLLPNRPLSAVYMPYLLSYCARAAVAPRSCRCWPSLALACAALVSCAMGRGEWLCCCCICCICCWCSPQAKKIPVCAISTSTHAGAAALFSLLRPLLLAAVVAALPS